MTISVIKCPSTGNISIATDFIVNDWSFIQSIRCNSLHYYIRILSHSQYSCFIKPNYNSIIVEELQHLLVCYFNTQHRYDLKVLSQQTLQELTSILRRLEREVNPSFKQHTKTLLGLL